MMSYKQIRKLNQPSKKLIKQWKTQTDEISYDSNDFERF